MEKRKDFLTIFSDLKIIHVQCPLYEDFNGQAPTGIKVIGRIRYLTINAKLSVKETIEKVASELSEIWIYGLNIYPMTVNNIIKKLTVIYLGAKANKDFEVQIGFKPLLKWPRKDSTYDKRVKNMSEILKTGFDIKTNNDNRIKICEQINLVKMTEDEKKLYEDNCKIKTCSCAWNSVTKCQECPRQIFSTEIVDKKWQNWKSRKLRDLQSLEIQREIQNKIENHDLDNDYIEDMIGNVDEVDYLPGDIYTPPKCVKHDFSKVRTDLRSSEILQSSEQTRRFPKVPLRLSKSEINPKVMRAIIHCQASYKVSDRDLEGVIVDIANMIFDQTWVKCDEGTFYEELSSDSDSEVDTEFNKRKLEACEEAGMQFESPTKKRRVKKNLNCSFPSRATRRSWLRQGAILNLRHLGMSIAMKSEETVITYGFDDTTKAGGNKVFDIKASNITLDGDGMNRQTFTTGFTPNISHSGQDQSTSMKYSLQTLAVLIREEIGDPEFSYNDLVEHIDFFMCDRSSDGNIVLDELGVEDSQRLKCSAHVILSIDEALDSVLKDVESSIGRDKLIGSNIGGAFQTSSSIITLGLIAFAKALSPSHAALSYSLYMQYKTWRSEKELENKGSFKGFQSNRIGRITFLASLYLEHKIDLLRFFEETVDENSNKLVLALSDYLSSEWFSTGCEVYKSFGHLIINPLCNILGIDEFGKTKRDDRNWQCVKDFFEKKLQELKTISITSEEISNKEKLLASCATKVVDNIERQLNQMAFFRGEIDNHTKLKMQHTPLTNLGCESRMAQFDNRVKFSRGFAPISTLSDKQVVATNKYLLQPKLDDPKVCKAEFTWAKNSKPATEVNKLQQEYFDKVKATQNLAFKAKEMAKQKKVQRACKLLSNCRQHGGPISLDNIYLLDSLDEEQIILEATYLKATIAKEIKLKKRVKDLETTKFRMVKLPLEQIKQSILNVINPKNDVSDNVDDLLSTFFSV